MKISEMNVEYVDHMGSDLSVVNAARVSFAKQSEWESIVKDEDGSFRIIHVLSEKDTKLINYLAKHNHWTPYAHTSVSLRIKAPIFIARQLVKHQVGLVWNEVSRRYVDDEPEFWFPKEWRGKPVNAKQGSEGVLEHPEDYFNELKFTTNTSLRTYDWMLRHGVAPEQARMVLPLNTMTEWIWTGSMAAFARVYKLRADTHAQLEVQEIAHRINDIIQPLYPVSWKALTEN